LSAFLIRVHPRPSVTKGFQDSSARSYPRSMNRRSFLGRGLCTPPAALLAQTGPNVAQTLSLMPHTFDPGDHPAQIVGQPILAAAGFSAGLCPREGSLTSRRSRLKGGCGQDCPPHNKCRTSPTGKVCGIRLSVCRVPAPRDALWSTGARVSMSRDAAGTSAARHVARAAKCEATCICYLVGGK
jgi:hypothetical protein